MQISRLIEMIHILLDKRAVTAAELAEHFEISVRTVYRDIEALSQAGFPVYAERGRSGGIRITEGYSLDKSVLTDEEKTELIGALAGFAALGASDSRAASHIRSFFGGAEEPDWVQIDFSDWGSSQQELYADIRKCIFESVCFPLIIIIPWAKKPQKHISGAAAVQEQNMVSQRILL